MIGGKALLCVLALMLASFSVQAEEIEADIDFFEFLAEWETDDGQWVEPSSLDFEQVSGEDENDDED
jgi:hypothetical protein